MTASRFSWTEVVKKSLPEYASDLVYNLSVCENSTLSEIDFHTCALAAAIASGNGELAMEINHSTALIGNPIREEVAAIVSFAILNSCLGNYQEVTRQNSLHGKTLSTGIKPRTDFKYVTKTQEFMYHLVTYVVTGSLHGIKHYKMLLQNQNVSEQGMLDITKIASVVTAIGKTII